MRILYIGCEFRGSNSTSMRDAFIQLGHEVRTVDMPALASWPSTLHQRLIAKVSRHPGHEKMRRLNEAVVNAAREYRPDLTFFFPVNYITGHTLGICREFGPTAAMMPDDMMNHANRFRGFLDFIRHVDCFFTTKSYNVAELLAEGAARVEYIPCSYDPAIHYPVPVQAEDRAQFACDLGFIGTFRPERADFLERLATACPGMSTRVWGGGWRNMTRPHYRFPRKRWPTLAPLVSSREVLCEEYAKAIQCSGVVLGLLNHANRDLHTARTFEIPACGGFMLAERSVEHSLYFEEDKEAVYFDSFDEMLDKIRYFSRHEAERRRIAEAGHRRAMRSGYSYADRARTMFRLLGPSGN